MARGSWLRKERGPGPGQGQATRSFLGLVNPSTLNQLEQYFLGSFSICQLIIGISRIINGLNQVIYIISTAFGLSATVPAL